MLCWLQAWARLLRISLSPTAVADVLAGLVVAGGGLSPWPRTLALVGSSLCVYHGGMALNDWADRKEDALVRPDRPIPSGRIGAGAALLAALALFVAGPLLASTISTSAGLWVAGVGLCAASYDLFGRGPWLGPGLLGLCRFGNFSIGFVALGMGFGSVGLLLLAPLLYGLYVFLLSRLGRLEDGEQSSAGLATPRRLLVAMVATFLAVPLLPVEQATLWGRGVSAALVLGASWGLLQQARQLGSWSPAEIIPAMGCALRRMLVFSAALAALFTEPRSLHLVVLILALYPVAWYLRKLSPPS